ncbi:hypothetical protein CYMTET_22818 [Cymbomonas tetramitiformis]|uniref:Uncharacterized protein n=1 Tax=Cymbomonas tetramitiformis TaxID=36881 RepID=A0AAE0FZI9_9CHLO|nr:hypothetical protein CYMTET_22818 [Cymbomonas tetramitiformis]
MEGGQHRMCGVPWGRIWEAGGDKGDGGGSGGQIGVAVSRSCSREGRMSTPLMAAPITKSEHLLVREMDQMLGVIIWDLDA